jgi:hypothetical protein
MSPSEIIFQADDIVFPKGIARLNFDENETAFPGIQNAVGSHAGNIDGPPGGESNFFPFEGDKGFPFHHDPMLRPLFVALIAQSPLGQDFNSLYLVTLSFLQDCIASPRTSFGHNPFPFFFRLGGIPCGIQPPEKMKSAMI